MDKTFGSFIWDDKKELENIGKHGVDFPTAVEVFKDKERKIYTDSTHSKKRKECFVSAKPGGGF